MKEFTKLRDVERQINWDNSKTESAIDIDLGYDTSFDSFQFHLTMQLGGDIIYLCKFKGVHGESAVTVSYDITYLF